VHCLHTGALAHCGTHLGGLVQMDDEDLGCRHLREAAGRKAGICAGKCMDGGVRVWEWPLRGVHDQNGKRAARAGNA